MAQPTVLVTFACRTGHTEKIALSAAVGAVQARALIRLRRLPDVTSTESTETVIRMRKEYVPPTEKDILGADALIMASTAVTDPSSPQWQNFLNLLRKLRDEGKLRSKVGATIGGLYPVLGEMGFVTLPQSTADPVELGRNVANRASALKKD